MATETMARLRTLYENYLALAEKLEQNKRAFAGFLGLVPGPGEDPGHDRFAQDLEQLLTGFSHAAPRPEEIRQVLDYVYAAPVEHPQPRSSYWMLLAVHGLTLELIGGLNAADARELADWYEGAFPRRERVPVQNKVLKALKAAGKAS